MNTAPGEPAIHLPWLSPCAASLVLLAKNPVEAVWSRVRFDPGCVLQLLRTRYSQRESPGEGPLFRGLSEQKFLHSCWFHLHQESIGHVNWNRDPARPLYQSSLRFASLAQRLAHHTKCCDANGAWVGGFLAPLGWFALAAVHPGELPSLTLPARHLPSPTLPVRPTSIARRLSDQWDLPAWLSALVGHLALPAPVAVTLGAEEDLFRIVQLAVSRIEIQTFSLGLGGDRFDSGNRDYLHLSEEDLLRLEEESQTQLAKETPQQEWESPFGQPLLLDLLKVAAENHQLREKQSRESLHQKIDHLQEVLLTQTQTEENRLHEKKLQSLAEFAAGAAHEINNPLAVISGQAQYLLIREMDPNRKECLQTIINQTRRVDNLLKDLRQFACPPKLNKQLLDVGALIRQVVQCSHALAQERRIQLCSPEPKIPITLSADPDQIKKALGCLVQNAMEAAPEQGWVKIRVELPRPDVLHLIVEDNGKGPNPADQEHLFDPFYSGRSAGRGHGLGLPLAWRLAQLHQGQVFWEDTAGGPTRFVLQLPLEITADGPSHSKNRNGCHLHLSKDN